MKLSSERIKEQNADVLSQMSKAEMLVYGLGAAGGGALGWGLSKAINSAEQHRKRRWLFALAGAAAGSAGAYTYLDADSGTGTDGDRVSNRDLLRLNTITDKTFKGDNDVLTPADALVRNKERAEQREHNGGITTGDVIHSAAVLSSGTAAGLYSGVKTNQGVKAINNLFADRVNNSLRRSGVQDLDKLWRSAQRTVKKPNFKPTRTAIDNFRKKTTLSASDAKTILSAAKSPAYRMNMLNGTPTGVVSRSMNNKLSSAVTTGVGALAALLVAYGTNSIINSIRADRIGKVSPTQY